MGAERLEIRLLGPFEVTVDGRVVVLSAGRLRSLLAALALSPGAFVSVGRLAEAVWGDDQPSDVRRSMQTYVARLRAALGVPVIVTELGGYALRVEPDGVDAVRFQRLLEAAGATRDPAAEHALLAEALGLWQGNPLAGVPSERLADAEAALLTDAYLSALERRIDLDLDAGAGIQAAELIAELREHVDRHPLRESLWALFLRALVAGGRQAEALEQYGTVRERIAAELGVEPGPELQRLYAGLLAGDLPAERSRGPAAVPAQIAVPQQLPSDTPRFTGRTAELSRLDQLLRTGPDQDRTNTVVVLHGEGGAGKSALAVHWAHRTTGDFPGGRVFLNLRGYGPGDPVDPAAALDDVLRSLGLPGDRIPAGLDARSALLRTTLSGRRILLVLDNARDAEQVRPLLPGGGAMVLVTSRSRLGGLAARDGAALLAVDELPAPDARDLLARGLGASAGQLRSGVLAEVAELCGRLPLALNLAAERLAHDTAELTDLPGLRSVADRLDVLDSGDQDPVTNLRAVFSWSVQALEPELARTFRLLGLHPGEEFGAEASAALLGTGVPQTRRALERLVAVHLVRRPRAGRYVLHDLLRAYAVEQAGAVDGPEAVKAAAVRLLSWMMHTVDNAAMLDRSSRLLAPLPPAEDGVVPLRFDADTEALGWLDLERPGLLAAVHQAAEHGLDTAAAQLAGRMWTYLDIRDALDEAMAVQTVALAAAERTGDPWLVAAAANQLGTGIGRSGRLHEALGYFERAAAMFEAAGNTAGQSAVYTNLGLAYTLLGEFEESVRVLNEGLRIAAEDGAGSRPSLLNNLAMGLTELGRYDEAVAAAAEAVELHRRERLRRDEAYALDTLGSAYRGQGSLDKAIEAGEASAELHRELGNRPSEAIALTNLGRAQRDDGRYDEARRSWTAALGIVEDLAPVRDTDDVGQHELRTLLAELP